MIPHRHPLTPREAEVARLILDGLKTNEIAARLGTSPKTVSTQRTSLYEKLGIRNVADLFRVMAVKRGKLYNPGGNP